MDAEKFKEISERIKHNNSIPGIYERFAIDVRDYLASKFPDIPSHEIDEAAVFIGQKFGLSVNDVIIQRDREWKRNLQRQARSSRVSCYEQLRQIKNEYKRILEEE